jgi:23S rRNA (adenine2030-N6)-methyltransferase
MLRAMNYRHAYHAGNFADVLKHAVLALCIAHLKRKEAPFRVIDTHAGAGRYDLAAGEAEKTGEWRDGIGRLLGRVAEPLPQDVAGRLSPYLDAVRAENVGGALRSYPGSPAIALRLLRPQDTLVANELHPDAHRELKALLGRDRRVKLMQLDGWVALRALLPPKERRGIVLIDPPYEEEGEFARCANGLAQGLHRFATGVFILWYPIKDEEPIGRFHQAIAQLRIEKLLGVELVIRRASDRERLNGCGLVIANPPYSLETELQAVLPALAKRLAADAGARHRLARISPAEISDGAHIGGRRPIRIKP